MDAVVFMDAVKASNQPPPASPPPSERKPQGVTANAALIAGIGTLVLAIGVGVLIGRSGDNGSATAANAAPQIIKVGGGSEAESTEPGTEKEAKSSSKGKGGSSKASKSAKAKAETGSSGTTKAAEEVLKPAGDVKLPPPTTQVGGKCEKGTSGCSDSGEFNGNFFGE